MDVNMMAVGFLAIVSFLFGIVFSCAIFWVSNLLFWSSGHTRRKYMKKLCEDDEIAEEMHDISGEALGYFEVQQ